MGCSGSKVEDLPLVIRCRERKDLIKAAGDHRYALAAAHVAYFQSLTEVGDALRKFVEEELVVGAAAASNSSTTTTSASSPMVTLHSLEEEEDGNNGGGDGEVKEKKKGKGNFNSSAQGKSNKSKSKNLSSDDSGSVGDSHVHLSSDDDSDVSHNHRHHNHHLVDSREDEDIHAHHDDSGHHHPGQYGYGYGMPPPGYGGMMNGMQGPGYGGMMNEPPQGYGMMNGPPPGAYWGEFPSFFGMNQPYRAWEQQPNYENPSTSYRNTNVYYMKKSSPVMKTVIHEPESATNGYSNSYFTGYPFENAGFYGYGYQMGQNAMPERGLEGRKPSSRVDPPPPPSPKVSTWDFFNPFDAYDNGYEGLYSKHGYGYGSSASSPDSTEVRKREGIPDLEEETENEVYRDAEKGKKVNEDVKRPRHSGESTSGSRAVPLRNENSSKTVPLHKSNEAGYRKVPFQTNSENDPKNSEGSATQMSSPQQYNEGSSKAVPSEKGEATGSIDLTESSSGSILSSKSPKDVYLKKKGVSFEVDDTDDIDSSKFSSLTPVSPHGTRDLREVVAEIRDEFAIASDNGKEVALMLEVGKLPYQPNLIGVVLSRILYLMSPSLSSSSSPVSRRSVRLAAKTLKMAKSYFGDVGMDLGESPCNLSCTLEKLYAWEKKLYKEVKDEERLRVIYEKLCKRLRMLDEKGAESSKIEPVRASIRRSLTKLNVCIKTIDSISNRIHKLRDEELQPQVAQLIHGLIRMWKTMFRCHQKQFQAIMESKVRALKENTGFQKDSGLRATIELEMELRSWLGHFNNWITTQKSYVESLNGWLLRCLLYEPEETPDGPVPYSPGRLGAPPVFVICNDWNQAMETISETRVANAMNNFASSLRELWEKQDEEQRQRLKANGLSEDIKNRLKTVNIDERKTKREGQEDTLSDRSGSSSIVVPSDSRVSRMDDLKVDLDTVVGQRLAEEKAKHKDAIKAASSSVQGGLVPIFKALESFALEVLKAHEQVRLHNNDDEQRL